ncbi:MAG: type II secretion system protein [Patescibacteria group bacterium]
MKGFTLIELLVSVAIFVMMTALLVARYGNFNQSVLLTNLAYDVALTIRTAQTFGLSIKNQGASFQNVYGVELSTDPAKNKSIVLFASTNNSYFDSGEQINTYAIKRGAVISSICAGTGPGAACGPLLDPVTIDVSFKRPDPDAIICIMGSGCPASDIQRYVEFTLTATDGTTRIVSVRKTGQISVGN